MPPSTTPTRVDWLALSEPAAALAAAERSAARAPWDGARFDASWELGDSPAHFVSDGMHPDGALTTSGVTPFDVAFNMAVKS